MLEENFPLLVVDRVPTTLRKESYHCVNLPLAALDRRCVQSFNFNSFWYLFLLGCTRCCQCLGHLQCGVPSEDVAHPNEDIIYVFTM